MEPKIEQYFRDLNDLFRSAGWAIFIEDITESLASVDSIVSTKDEQDLFFRKGQIAVLSSILNMENQVAAAKEDAEANDNGATL